MCVMWFLLDGCGVVFFLVLLFGEIWDDWDLWYVYWYDGWFVVVCRLESLVNFSVYDVYVLIVVNGIIYFVLCCCGGVGELDFYWVIFDLVVGWCVE